MSSAVKKVDVEISVVLGKAVMPINQLLKMGRGAVIELDSHQDEPVYVLANNRLIARGEIIVSGAVPARMAATRSSIQRTDSE